MVYTVRVRFCWLRIQSYEYRVYIDFCWLLSIGSIFACLVYFICYFICCSSYWVCYYVLVYATKCDGKWRRAQQQQNQLIHLSFREHASLYTSLQNHSDNRGCGCGVVQMFNRCNCCECGRNESRALTPRDTSKRPCIVHCGWRMMNTDSIMRCRPYTSQNELLLCLQSK